MTIGRDEANDIRLENRALSRKHAKIEVRGGSLWVRDLGSQNGTFINGERIEGAKVINGGDIISLGGKFDLRLEGVEEAKNTTPVLTLTGPEGTHRFAMVGEEIVLGRSPDCDISIGRKSISRRHLKVFIKDTKFFAEDLGSQNGTRVNGEKIRGVTEVAPDDEIRVSEYLIKVSHLEQAQDEEAAASGVHKPNRTMLLDRSKLAAAADLGGDFQIQVTHENRLTFPVEAAQGGIAPGTDWNDGDDLADTAAPPKPLTGAKSGAIRPPMKGGAAAAPPPPPPPPPAPAAPPAAKTGANVPAPPRTPTVKGAPEATLEVTGADGAVTNVPLQKDVVLVSEDGSEPPVFEMSHFAPVAYVMFVPMVGGWLGAVLGDRRLLDVGGGPSLYRKLQDGDVLTLGAVSITYRER